MLQYASSNAPKSAKVELNEEYEKAVAVWLPEHPFLDDTQLRNVVFAAVAVVRCALSDIPEYRELAHDYVRKFPPTYHLLYIMAEFAKSCKISAKCFNMLIQSCSEFININAEIAIDIDGQSWEDSESEDNNAELSIVIEFPEKKQERTFIFSGLIDTYVIPLGPYLINTRVTVPCQVDLLGTPAIEAMGDSSISARNIRIDTADLIVRSLPRVGEHDTAGLLISAENAEGHANAVSVGAGKLEIQCVEHQLDYPLATYVQKVAAAFADPSLRAKHRKLRRILSEFRSHKKGNLAKYRDKIENERIAGNPLGKKILAALLKEGVLWSDQKFYYVAAEQCDEKLGISWHQLRQYRTSSKLEVFLRAIS
jgi:hypothetical protein